MQKALEQIYYLCDLARVLVHNEAVTVVTMLDILIPPPSPTHTHSMDDEDPLSDNYAMFSDEDSQEDNDFKAAPHVLFCEVCDTTFTSSDHLQAHFAGARHRKALEKAGLSAELTEYIQRPKNLEIWNVTVKCLLCKVMLLGCDSLIHAKSDKHLRKLSEMSRRNSDFYSDIGNCFVPVEMEEDPRKRGCYFCEQCRIELSGKEHLELHLKGKKHQQKARWLYLDQKDEQDSRRVWCTLCKKFVNSIQELEQHFVGRTHIRTLKRHGVKYELLLDQFGEERVGGRPVAPYSSRHSPRPRDQSASVSSRHMERSGSGSGHSVGTSDRDRYRPRHSSDHEDFKFRHHSSGSRSRHSSEDGRRHSSSGTRAPPPPLPPRDRRRSRERSRSRSPLRHSNNNSHSSSLPRIKKEDISPSPPPPPPSPPPPPPPVEEFKGLIWPKWEDAYDSLPEYHQGWPDVLRDGRKHHKGAVIYQKPLLAVADYVGRLEEEDPKLVEQGQRIEQETKKREKEEREKEKEEGREFRGRGGGREDGRRDSDRRDFSRGRRGGEERGRERERGGRSGGGYRGRSFSSRRRESDTRSDRRDQSTDRRDLRRSLDDRRRQM